MFKEQRYSSEMSMNCRPRRVTSGFEVDWGTSEARTWAREVCARAALGMVWMLASLLPKFSHAAAEPMPALSAPAAWYAAYLRNSQLVSIPGARSLNLYFVGTGSPTLLLK